MMNSVNLIGRLGQAPGDSLRYAQTGTAMLPFTIAINRRQAKDGSSQTDGLIVSPSSNRREHGHIPGKRLLVGVEGRIQTRKYETQDGRNISGRDSCQYDPLPGQEAGTQDNNQVKAVADNWADIGRR